MLSGETDEPPERERDSTGGNISFMEFAVGAILEGKVTGITKFGAFVALPGGKSGLVHISNISDSYVSDINEFLTVGQEVKVKVMNIDQNVSICPSNTSSLRRPHVLPAAADAAARPRSVESGATGVTGTTGAATAAAAVLPLAAAGTAGARALTPATTPPRSR